VCIDGIESILRVEWDVWSTARYLLVVWCSSFATLAGLIGESIMSAIATSANTFTAFQIAAASIPPETYNEIMDVVSIANECGESVLVMLYEHFCMDQEKLAACDKLLDAVSH
jgi:hypothetical protein